MRGARVALVAVGVLLCGVGAVFLVQDVAPTRWPGIVLWLALAIVLHDGVLSPFLVAVGLGAARRSGRLGRRTTTLLQALLVVGGTLTLMAMPGLIAVARGSANPTISIGPYALALGCVWAVLGIAAAVVLATARRRPQAAAVETRRARTK